MNITHASVLNYCVNQHILTVIIINQLWHSYWSWGYFSRKGQKLPRLSNENKFASDVTPIDDRNAELGTPTYMSGQHRSWWYRTSVSHSLLWHYLFYLHVLCPKQPHRCGRILFKVPWEYRPFAHPPKNALFIQEGDDVTRKIEELLPS